MAFPGRLLAVLHIFLCVRRACGQTVTTSVTTISGISCATPSCTVTPEPITDLTIHPSPTTVFNLPGRLLPLVFSFDDITITSHELDPTTLANDGKGVLTLGSTTITDFPSASASQTYTVEAEPDVTLTAAVTVKVQAKAQLFIAEESDPDSVCALFPDVTRRRDLLRSRITGGRLKNLKRTGDLEDTTDQNAKDFAQKAISEAKRVVASFLNYFGNAQPTLSQLASLGLVKWLPIFQPDDTCVSTFPMIRRTVQALSRFLNNMGQNEEFIVTALNSHTELRNSRCLDDKGNPNAFAVTSKFSGLCPRDDGYTIFCPDTYSGANSLATADQGLIDDVLAGPCNDIRAWRLDYNTYNLHWESGARAGLLIHQLLHLEQVGKDAGWPVVNGHQTFANWNVDLPTPNANPEIYGFSPTQKGVYTPSRLMSLSILPLDQRIFNAQNWEFTLSEFYIRRFCKLTTDGQPWPDFGNGP